MNIHMVLDMFADKNRLRIISILFEKDLTVTQITEVLDLKQANTSRHLAKLYEIGLVVREQDKKNVIYSLNPNYKASCKVIRPVLKAFRGKELGASDMKKLKEVLKRK